MMMVAVWFPADCTFMTMCFAVNGILLCLQEVFTTRPTLLPLHLNSTPGKHQMAKNRIVFDRCAAYAAVKFITVRVCIDGPCVHDG